MEEPQTLAQHKLAKRQEVAERAEADYWEAFSYNPGLPAGMLKDYILSIAPQTGLTLTQGQKDARQASRATIDRCLDKNRQITLATSTAAVAAITW